MRIQYKISYSEFFEAQRALLGLPLVWILGAIFIILGILQLLINPTEYPESLILITMGFIFAFCWRLSIRRMYRSDNRFKQSYEVAISETGIEITGQTSASQHRWENFIGHKNTKNTVVLLQSPSVCMVFPKSAFSTQNLAAFNELVLKHVPPFTHRANRIRTVILSIIIIIALILLVFAIRNIQHEEADEKAAIARFTV